MANSVLKYALIEAQLERKTGKIQMIGTLRGISKSASIDLSEGRVISIRFGGDRDSPAIDSIVRMSLSRVIFMKSAGINEFPAPHTPTMQVLLDRLSGQIVVKKTEPDDASIVARVVGILKPSLGSRAQSVVSNIASTNPPVSDLAGFLSNCKVESAKMVGAKQADQLFPKFERRTGSRESASSTFENDLYHESRRILTDVLGPAASNKLE